MTIQTHFATPERSGPDDIKSDLDFLTEEKSFLDIFSSFLSIAAIFDHNRQIVYGNQELLDMLGVESLEQIVGKRLGEAVLCIHSGENPYGCGTAEACRYCGAVNAIISSQNTGKKEVREARITTSADGRMKSLELKIASSPIKIKGREYYVFTVQDISDEKRKESLERIFLHDLINSASSLNGILSILKEELEHSDKKDLLEISEKASSDMMEEILFHRKLIEAEKGKLIPEIKKFKVSDLINPVINKVTSDFTARGKELVRPDIPDDLMLETDYVLFCRVLSNLLKNAFEASETGGRVSLSIACSGPSIRFTVSNSSEMPEAVKHQVFQRSFSTKGSGRGIGTHSVKLITESFLNGKVWFTSTAESGTSFFVEYPVSVK